MTRQQFEAMMLRYGISVWSDAAYRIAKMAAEWEREECAKVCEKLLQKTRQENRHYLEDGIDYCLEAIRARGQK